MFNQVNLIGNLTRTPELRSTPGGAKLTDFSVALNRKWTDQQGTKHEETTFVDVTAWGTLAENLCRFKKQGELLLIVGRLRQDKWTDKETGKQRSKLAVTAVSITFLPSGQKKDGSKSQRDTGAGDSGPGGYDDYATSLPGGEEPPF